MATAKCVAEILPVPVYWMCVCVCAGVGPLPQFGSVWTKNNRIALPWPSRRNGNIKFVLDRRILCEFRQRFPSACSGCSCAIFSPCCTQADTQTRTPTRRNKLVGALECETVDFYIIFVYFGSCKKDISHVTCVLASDDHLSWHIHTHTHPPVTSHHFWS